MEPGLSTACFLHHSLQIIKWNKNISFLTPLSSFSNCTSSPKQLPISAGDTKKLRITNTQLSPMLQIQPKKVIQNVNNRVKNTARQ